MNPWWGPTFMVGLARVNEAASYSSPYYEMGIR